MLYDYICNFYINIIKIHTIILRKGGHFEEGDRLFCSNLSILSSFAEIQVEKGLAYSICLC